MVSKMVDIMVNNMVDLMVSKIVYLIVSIAREKSRGTESCGCEKICINILRIFTLENCSYQF